MAQTRSRTEVQNIGTLIRIFSPAVGYSPLTGDTVSLHEIQFGSAEGSLPAQRKIIFLNRFFYPDHSATSEILSDLAFELASRRLVVNVITSRARYENGRSRFVAHEKVRGVDVYRVWSSRLGRRRLLNRAVDYATFYFTAAWRLFWLARSVDVIVAKTDPPLISVVAATIAWLRGAQLVNWQQDVFPEVAERLGFRPLPTIVFSLVRRLRDWSLQRASFIVVIGRRMGETFSRMGFHQERIRLIPNWADGTRILPIDASENPLREAWDLSNCFVVGYTGNLGRAHEIGTVLGAMMALKPRTKHYDETIKPIRFLFVGGGHLRIPLEREVKRLCLSNAVFRDYQPRSKVSETLCVPDVHLIILKPEVEGLIVPSKLYAIAAAGRPAIFIGDRSGEVADLLAEHGFGFCVEPTEVEELKRTILHLAASPELCRALGDRARNSFERLWDKPIAMEQWNQLFADLHDNQT